LNEEYLRDANSVCAFTSHLPVWVSWVKQSNSKVEKGGAGGILSGEDWGTLPCREVKGGGNRGVTFGGRGRYWRLLQGQVGKIRGDLAVATNGVRRLGKDGVLLGRTNAARKGGRQNSGKKVQPA